MAVIGGAPLSVTTGGSGQTEARPAVPVYVVSGGQAPVGGRARRVVVVTSGPVEGGAPIPVYDAGNDALYSADAALPVYVVSGILGVQAPANTVLPVVSGITTVGQTLSTTDGTWANTPTNFSYQWKRNGANIGGATGNTYVIQAADANTTLTVTVTATNAAGSTSATSAGTSIELVLNSLVSEYRFNDGSGTTLTDYVTGYNGTLGTGGSDQPDWVTAGLDFVPGNSDVVTNATMPDSVLLGALTVCVVAQLDTGSAFREFLSKTAGNGATNCPLEFRTSNAATPVLVSVRSNAGGTKTYNGQSTAVGAYRMYTVVYTDGNVDTVPTFYLGTSSTGGSGATGTGTGAATGTSQNLRIGRRADGAVQMDGIMAYILIYNRALSAAEITQNYTVLQARMALRGVTLP